MDLQQNTPEWLEFRKNRIGASDANIIMKKSPWSTPYQLWRQKLSFDKPQQESYVQAEGKRKEPIALAALEEKLGMSLKPQIRLSNERSWMMASLDALSSDNRIVGEIKCPGKEDHESALSGHVPEKYYAQLQHQIVVCEVEFAYYFSYQGENNVLIRMERDEKFIKDMLKEEEKFYECMMNFESPDLTERDFVTHSDVRWQHLAHRLQEIKTLQTEEEAIKKELIQLANGQNAMGYGIKVAKCVRKGNIDYSSIPELQSLDLNAFRKKSIEYWRVS